MSAVPGTSSQWIHDESVRLQPSAARVYDYLLGGAHNFAVDRELAERLLKLLPNPNAVVAVRANRAFLRRAVLFMVDQGIRQFLDLGSGIPTVGNVHEVAQNADPRCRVVYVDFDDVAAAHGELLLEGNDRAAMVQADATLPDVVLDAPQTRRLINLDEPLGLLAVALLHYVPPDRNPGGVLHRYREAMAGGSYLAVSHAANDFPSIPIREASEEMRKASAENVFARSRAEVLALFDGFELVEPGLVTTSTWRPDHPTDVSANPEDDGLYAGVCHKK